VLPVVLTPAGWLLVLITAGAVACSVVFEKRLWCRFLCPIGKKKNSHLAGLSLCTCQDLSCNQTG